MKKENIKLFYGKFALAGICILVITFFSAISYSYHDIVIKVDNYEVSYSFNGKKTVAEVLEENHIEIQEEDKLSHAIGKVVENGEEINIEKARPVVIHVGDAQYQLLTSEKDIDKILDDANISLGPLDIIEKDKEEPDQIRITSVKEELETKEEIIKHKEVKKNNSSLESGKENIIQDGKDGFKTTIEKIVFHNDKEFSREIIEEKIENPIDKIVEKGTKETKETHVASRGAVQGEKVTLEATGYCSCPKCVAPYDGTTTASGTKPAAGRTIAASKKYDFGTKIYIPSMDTTYIVEDRGGAITGNRIDIYFDSHQEALNFGRRTVEAIIIK